jgi:hypothetical protein
MLLPDPFPINPRRSVLCSRFDASKVGSREYPAKPDVEVFNIVQPFVEFVGHGSCMDPLRGLGTSFISLQF